VARGERERAGQAERIRADIAAEERRQRELTLLLGEFEHETRRCRDALERVGGRAPEIESKARDMRRGQEDSERALMDSTRKLDALRRRLAEVTDHGDVADT